MTMTPLEIVREGMHGMLDKAVEEMSAEQLNFRPREGGVSAFFSLWHYVRTEDNVINYVAQGRNTVWLADGYNERFNLPRTSQGTGMSDEEARAIAINDPAAFLEYQRKVWAATDEFLAGLNAAALTERKLTVKPLGEMPLWNALNGLGLHHGYRHVGEIEYARGVQGLGGLSI